MQAFFHRKRLLDTYPPNFKNVRKSLKDLEQAVLFQGCHAVADRLFTNGLGCSFLFDQPLQSRRAFQNLVNTEAAPIPAVSTLVAAHRPGQDKIRSEEPRIGKGFMTVFIRSEE